MKRFFAFMAACLLAACNQQDNPSAKPTALDTAAPASEDSVKRDSSFVYTDSLKDANDKKTIQVNVMSGDHITAQLLPADSTANLRINQVIYPDGKMDGPFNREIDIATTSAGTVQIIIGANLMAEGNWMSPFNLTVRRY